MPLLSWFLTALTSLGLFLTPAAFPQQQAPATPGQVPGLRIYTGERGMYRITGAELRAAGVPLDSIDPGLLALWHLDQPVAVWTSGSEDGRLDVADAVVFYAEPYTGRYMTSDVYKLTWSGSTGVRMAERPAPASSDTVPVSATERTLRFETDAVYYSTYHLPRDADHFFGDTLFANASAPVVTTTHSFKAIAPLSAGTVRVVARLHGGNDAPGSGPDQAVAIRFNETPAATFTWEGSRIYTATLELPAGVLQPITNTITLEARLDQLPGLTNFWISPDWVEVTYPSAAQAADDRLYMPRSAPPPAAPGGHRLYMPLLFGGSPASAGPVLRVGGLSSPPEVFDVTDPRRVVRLRDFAIPFWNNYSAVFAGNLKDHAYFVTTISAMQKPLALAPDYESDWRSPAHEADYIAIVHRSLWDAVQPLLDHRAAEGLRVAKVDVQDVYDEFSGGRVDPEALRSFLAYAYREWNPGGPRPTYVVLVGDGHYDFKNVFQTNLPNLIPPYLLDVDPYIGETGADNRYVTVDGDDDYVPDMAIGRIPAKNSVELTAYGSKVLAYERAAPDGDWQARAIFVADAAYDSAGNFHALSEESRVLLSAAYDARTIYFGASPATDTAAEMRSAMRAAFDGGAIYFQWFGHASRQRWGGGLNNMYDLTDPPKLAPNVIVPFTAAYSCWSGYFLNARGSPQYGNSEQSLGEALVMAPGRGSLVDLSPTGLHVGSALVRLNQEVVKAIFVQRQDRVGVAVTQAKVAFYQSGAGFADLLDTQVLLGDPAVKLRLPPG